MSSIKAKYDEELDTLFEGTRRGARKGKHNWKVLFDGRSHFVVEDKMKLVEAYLKDKKVDTDGLSEEEMVEAFTEVSGMTLEDIGELHHSKAKSYKSMAWQTAKRRGLNCMTTIHPRLGCLVIKAMPGEVPAENGDVDATVEDGPNEEAHEGAHEEAPKKSRKKK